MPHQIGIAKRYIVWSGGADSTLVLTDALYEAVEGKAPIPIAITLRHEQVNSVLDREAERLARYRFQTWARTKLDIAFPCATVEVVRNRHAAAGGRIGQAGLFLSHLFPYVQDTEPTTVELGYIQGDDFWHHRHEYVSAFDALAKFSQASTSVQFPLEWVTKETVLFRLKNRGVPRDCWWTCDRTLGTKDKPVACGSCLKCKAIGQPKPPARYLRDEAAMPKPLRGRRAR